MVQKTATKLRGRPRKYQTETALSQAMDVFWRAGFAGTSMDDLSEATQMNRPSLYHAFGDKRQLYLSLLDLYIANTGSAVAEALGPGRSLRQALTDFYATVLKVYFSPTGVARGCFLIGTAVTEAGGDEEVRTKLAEALNGFRTALSRACDRLASRANSRLERTSTRSRTSLPQCCILWQSAPERENL